MGVVTLGTTSTTWTPFVGDTGSITTSWRTDTFGGNTDPTSGRQLYSIYYLSAYVKYYDTSGTEKVQFLAGSSHGSTSKLAYTDADALTTSSYAWRNCDLRPAVNDKTFIVGDNTTYYTGVYSPSSSGVQTTRTNVTTDPTPTVTTDNYTVRTIGTAVNTYDGQQALKIYFFGLPNQVTGLAATVQDSTSIRLTWNTGTAPDTEGYVTQYRVQYSTSSSFSTVTTKTTTSTSYTVTGLSASTKYYFRVAAQNRIKDMGWPDASGPWSTSVNATTESGVLILPTFSGSFGNGTVNSYYDDQVTVANATSITTRTGHSIPPGLGVDTDNKTYYRLYGTPTTSGVFYVVLSATNSDGTTDDPSDSITIDPEPVPDDPVWNTGTYDDFYVNVSYSDQVTAVNALSYTITSGTLPTGLQFDSSNARIYGTPEQSEVLTEIESVTFTITAYGETGSVPQSKQFTVNFKFPGKRMTGPSSSDRLTVAKRRNPSNQWESIQYGRRYNGGAWVPLKGFN